jgi:hypothetical protein
MYLRVSDISKYLGCPRAIEPMLRDSSMAGGYSGLDESIRGETEALKIGNAAHKVVQYVLDNPPEEREKVYEEVRNALDSIKQDVEMPSLISDILGENFLHGAIHDQLLMSSWKECHYLLYCSISLLRYLEKIPDSEGKWEIKAEMKIHGEDVSSKGVYLKDIFGSKTLLHGSIDLVLEYEDYFVVAELKTGAFAEWKKKTWELQTKIYSDACKFLYPDKKIAGFILHKYLTDGYNDVDGDSHWADSLDDSTKTIPGEHCQYCDQKLSCNASWFKQISSIR